MNRASSAKEKNGMSWSGRAYWCMIKFDEEKEENDYEEFDNDSNDDESLFEKSFLEKTDRWF